MSLHSPTSLMCSPGFLDIHPLQLGASSSIVDWRRLRSVQLQRRFRRLCAITPLRSIWDRRRFVVINATQDGSGAGKEIKFDDVDLMTMEFGRLLGEPKNKTLSKVIKRKMEPDATYLELEKVSRKGNRSKLSIKSDLANYKVNLDKPKRPTVNDAVRQDPGSATSKLRYLASPPVRQNVTAGKVSQSVQHDTKTAAQSIKRLQMETNETVDESLLRRPSLDRTSTDGTNAVLLTEKLTSHVFTNMKVPNVESSGKESNAGETNSILLPTKNNAGEDLLRKPSVRNVEKARYKSLNELNGKLKDQDLAFNSGADESLLQRSFLDQKQTDSIAGTLPTGTARQSLSRSMQGQTMESLARESSTDDDQLRRPSVKIVTKTSSKRTNEHNRILVDDEMLLNARAANACPENFQISEIEEKNSLSMSQFEVLPELQDNRSIDSSENEDDDMLDKSLFQVPEKSLLAETSEQIRAHADASAFITVSKQKEQPGKEGPLVEASASLDSGPHSQHHMKPSRTDLLANGSQSDHMSAVSSQGKVQNFRVEKLQAPKRPGKTLLVQKEEGTASEKTSFKPDSLSKSNLHSAAGPRVENNLVRQADSSDERVMGNLDIVNAAGEDSIESLLIQGLPSAMSSDEHRSKVSIDSAVVTEEIPDITVGQARKTLQRPKQSAMEDEESDWTRAEALLKSKTQLEVTVIAGNSAKLTVAFGRLVGFIPLFELSPKRGLVEFSSWAQQKGFDVTRRKELKNGGVGDPDHLDTAVKKNGKDRLILATEGDIKDLRNKYTEEFISSFVGKKARVIVKSVDKNGRRLKFSEKEVDPDSRELAQKKADLMAELKVGDIVICEVRSITPIGVFVELNGVFALIHRSEVSWNAGVDPSSLLRIGEVIKARVCRLDRTLQRINLSLKQMQPDPLMETLESVVRDLEGETHEPQLFESKVVEWPELEVLIRQLEQMEKITCVSKGRCLRSAALAPAFQVFLSTSQDSGYTLLARLGNKIQEVLVDTTLDRDKMKEAILMCTFTQT